ncbi:MAG: hypothetical protein WBP46_03545 [Thiolinea sp.]
MRVVIALVALLYVLAAFYGYFWWNNRQHVETSTQAMPVNLAAPVKLAPEQLSFPDVKPVDDSQLINITQQLNTMQTAFADQFKQMELKQDSALKALQQQIDELKQATNTAQTKALSPTLATIQAVTPSTDVNAPPIEQMLETQLNTTKQRLKAGVSQLDLNLQAEPPDLARQSTLQQKVEDAFNQAELANSIQGRTECGQAFCKLDIEGKAPEGVDVLQTLWEQQVFPEATEVMTVPKADGSGWVVYVARDGQSLPTLP